MLGLVGPLRVELELVELRLAELERVELRQVGPGLVEPELVEPKQGFRLMLELRPAWRRFHRHRQIQRGS